MTNIRILKRCFHKMGGEDVNNDEIIERSVLEFQKVQAHMKTAKEENAVRTYEGLKNDYLSLKAVLTSLGVNLTDIDFIKE